MKKILSIILCYSTSAWGAVSFVQHAVGTSGPVTITSSGSGHAIVVILSDTGGNSPAPTDNATGGSNTYVEATGCRMHGNSVFETCWVTCNSKSGATSVSDAGTGGLADFAVFEYMGNATSNCVDVSSGTAGTASAAGTLLGSSMTITNAGDGIAAEANPASSISGISTPWGHFLGNANGCGSGDYFPGVVGSYAATFTGDGANDPFNYSQIAILPVPAATGLSVNYNYSK